MVYFLLHSILLTPFEIFICLFPNPPFSQSWRFCHSTLGSAGEKWVSPASSHTAGVARHSLIALLLPHRTGCHCRMSHFLCSFPWGVLCWGSFSTTASASTKPMFCCGLFLFCFVFFSGACCYLPVECLDFYKFFLLSLWLPRSAFSRFLSQVQQEESGQACWPH